jgi:hypothetical protein
MSQSDKDAFKAALLDLKDTKALNFVGAGGFINDQDSNYDFLRDPARKPGIDLQKLAG